MGLEKEKPVAANDNNLSKLGRLKNAYIGQIREKLKDIPLPQAKNITGEGIKRAEADIRGNPTNVDSLALLEAWKSIAKELIDKQPLSSPYKY